MTTTSPAIEMAALDAVAQADLIRHGEVTPAELAEWAIERIGELNPALNAVITPMYEQALATAAAMPATGPLAGVPFLVKDLITEVAGVPFSEGSASCAATSRTPTPNSSSGVGMRPALPVRPFADEIGRDPGRLHGRDTRRVPAHPDCVAALDDAVALCASLGHELVEADLPGLTPEVGAAIGSIFGAATAWVIGYWIRRLGRRPADDELEPLTRAYWERGQQVQACDYLLAIEDCQAFARGVAKFLTSIDFWLTPTMSTPPASIGEITSTEQEPFAPSNAAAPRSPTQVSSPTSRVARPCRLRCGGTYRACPSACISSDVTVTRRRCSGWPASSKPPAPGRRGCRQSPQEQERQA
jgi:Asp-tRNA(Asn)/Glu-tRNA(Gln) amidotransferase A subunit family amidase